MDPPQKCDCPRPHRQETCQGITPLSSIGSPPTINLLHPVIHSGSGGNYLFLML